MLSWTKKSKQKLSNSWCRGIIDNIKKIDIKTQINSTLISLMKKMWFVITLNKMKTDPSILAFIIDAVNNLSI